MHSKGIVQNPLSQTGRIAIALLVALLIIGLVWFFLGGGRETYQNKEKEVVTKAQVLRPEDRQWKLCWKKSPHAKSISGAREACNPAKVVRLDAAYFTVVATYEHQWQKHQAVLNWEKAKDQEKGYWSQPTPQAKGTWRMTRVSADLYNGWYHDGKGGEEGALWLEAIGK